MDPRLQELADVLVELCVRELLQKEKSRRDPDQECSGFEELQRAKDTRSPARPPIL